MDELNNNVLSYLDSIVSRWEKENFASTKDKLVCAFFPYVNFLNFTFPIYISSNGITSFQEWYTFDLKTNQTQKCDKPFGQYLDLSTPNPLNLNNYKDISYAFLEVQKLGVELAKLSIESLDYIIKEDVYNKKVEAYNQLLINLGGHIIPNSEFFIVSNVSNNSEVKVVEEPAVATTVQTTTSVQNEPVPTQVSDGSKNVTINVQTTSTQNVATSNTVATSTQNTATSNPVAASTQNVATINPTAASTQNIVPNNQTITNAQNVVATVQTTASTSNVTTANQVTANTQNMAGSAISNEPVIVAGVNYSKVKDILKTNNIIMAPNVVPNPPKSGKGTSNNGQTARGGAASSNSGSTNANSATQDSVVQETIDSNLDDDIKELLEKIKNGNSEKKKYSFEIQHVPNKLNYVSDRALKLAVKLISIGNFSIERVVEGNKEKIVGTNDIISLCDKKMTEYDVFEKIENDYDNFVSNKNSSYTSTHTNFYNYFYGDKCKDCKFEKCPKAMAIYILYLYNTGKLVEALKERKKFREEHEHYSPYFDFFWESKVGVKEVSDADYEFCKEVVNRGALFVDNVLNKDGKMEIYSKIRCNDFALINNQISQIPDITGKDDVYIVRSTTLDPDFCGDYICRLTCCPYEVCAYIYYMKNAGREKELEEQRTYYHENQKEIDEKIKEKIKNKIKELENAYQSKVEGFNEYKDKVENIDSLTSTLINVAQKSLHIMIAGNDKRGREQFIKKIAKFLKNENKTKGTRDFSFQQFSKIYAHTGDDFIEDEKSIEARKKARDQNQKEPDSYAKRDDNGILYKGRELMYFSNFENNYLYVLDNITEFLSDYKNAKEYSGISITRKQIEHVIEVLTAMKENEYIIITGTPDEIEKLLDLDQRINFVFKESVYTLPELSTKEMYELYIKGLDTYLLEETRKNEADVKAKFEDYVSFAKKAMPFDAKGLANYLAVYANGRGKIEFPQNVYKKETLEESLKNVIGLENVKSRVKDFEKYMMFQVRAKSNNIKLSASNMHMIFTGNPGTGKTTIARIMAKMLYDLGLIEENKLIEVERKDLIAQYIGQTAAKTSEVIESAMGGVLFVDEAYTLAAKKGSNDFGPEAIATLIKAMEDHKDKLVVIFAGYRDEMKAFLDTNPGISSRIGYTFDFEDYNSEELIKIFELKIKNMGFELADDVYVDLKRICDYFSKRKDFGNGRFVDKLAQEVVMNHAMQSDDNNINMISRKDIPTIEKLNNEKMVNVGKAASEELNELIGLTKIKEEMKDFEAYVRFVKNAEEKGLKIPASNLHMIFAGNPGTGKTTVARIIAKLLFEIGVIHENKLVEVERKDLVGEYIGQTAPKTAEVIEKAMGGVLFVDEAYTLSSGGKSGNDYGAEAIAALIKAMEDHKSELVVIFAGYTKEMEDFININPGIASRVGYTFNFEDYNPEELDQIFELKASKAKLRLEDGVKEKIHSIMNYFHQVEDFGNGRFVDKVFSKVLLNHAKNADEEVDLIRVKDIPEISDVTATMMNGSSMIDPSKITEDSLNKTAVHEVGHATLAYLLFKDPNILKITINAEGGGTLGYVMHKSDSRPYTQSREWITNKIMEFLAGMCAEQVFRGYNENGCVSDLESATWYARRMVTKYGMSSLGVSVIENPSGEVEKLVFEETNKILNECLEKTKEIITANKEKMQRVVDYLLEHKEINEEEFIREFNGNTNENVEEIVPQVSQETTNNNSQDSIDNNTDNPQQ